MSDASEHDAASAPDDSSDSEWAEDDRAADEWAEDVEVSSLSEEDAASVLSAAEPDLQDKIASLVCDDACGACLRGKEPQLADFLQSLARLSRDERKSSITTALAILKEADTASFRRGFGLRDKFAYFLPMIGRVCRVAFCSCYGVSPPTVARFRARIKGGDFSPKPHGGRSNNNAAKIDASWLVDWFTGITAEIGDVVPIKVRRQSTKDGRVTRYYSPEDYTLLPAYLTWDRLFDEMHKYIDENQLDVTAPAASTMRQLLTKRCPKIRIRSPRGNVCDECTIYYSRLRSAATTDETEAFGVHTAAARRMRQEYVMDMEAISDEHVVTIMDFSQNLTLPSLSNTPSQWYFLSLWAVNMFGVYYANRSTQYNYIYGEEVAGKGSEEVIFMLRHFLRNSAALQAPKQLTVYADNCTGQNKNNYVVKYLLALTHTGKYERVDLKFFVKGHTKNAVDRGFGHVRKRFAREDVWTMGELLEVVDAASASSATVHIEKDNRVFKSFKPVLTEAYRDIPAIRKFQLFSMSKALPGVVRCRVGPDDEPTEVDIRRMYDGIKIDGARVEMLLDEHLDAMPPPKPNTEKLVQMHDKVRPFVPDEFRDDLLYTPPTEEQIAVSKQIKTSRASSRKKQKDGLPTEAAGDASAADADRAAQPKAAETPKKKARKEQ